MQNYEIGIKSSWRNFAFDTSVYYSPVFDEVVQVIQPFGETEYVNAGETEKKGVEVALTWMPATGLSVGGSYTYSNYTYKEFSEPAFGTNIDRSGNHLPYIPEHYYSLFAAYVDPTGVYLRATANSWGEYWMDNANTEKYEGYNFVTDLTVGWQNHRFEAAVIIQNFFDQRYAVEAQKDLYGALRYSPAAPRGSFSPVSPANSDREEVHHEENYSCSCSPPPCRSRPRGIGTETPPTPWGWSPSKGGRALHPVHLPTGKERYTLVVTGTVIPPYRGDARVTVDGGEPVPFIVRGSDPIIDLALRRRPTFEDGTLTGLQPRDRFTVWVVIDPDEPMPTGKLDVTFTDTATNTPVLKIPVIFGGEEGQHHEH